ncbi:MAG: hypothetical protein ACR2MY_03540 [Candidatus Dormibacteria bacterium]
MRGTPVRVAQLAMAAGIAGVLTAGAAPALADNAISKYSGNATGQAIALQVNPNTVLDVRLSRLQQIINELDALPAGTTGVPGSLKNTIGSTLANPTAPINVAVDQVSAKGVSVDGTNLSDGSASSTAVAIDAKSLASEVALLNKAVQNMPDGTVAALQTALGPIAAADKTGQLAAALNTYLPTLSHPITGALGSPTLDLLRSVNANFGQDVKGDITTVQQGGLLTPNSQLKLQPFEARALPSDAFATNAVDNLALVPSGKLGLANPNQVALALKTIDGALIAAENVIKAATAQTGLGSVTDPVTGTVFPIINNTVGTASTTVQGVDLSAVNTLIGNLTATLSGIDGLQLNDIIGNNGANAVSSLKRSGSVVTASGLGEVAHVDVVKINDAQLQGILNTVAGRASAEPGNALEIASVDGVKATANVSLDGVHPATQSANGSLVDVKVLGRSLKSYAATAGQNVSLDDILPAGTTCTVNIPGSSTCHGIALQVPSTKGLEDALSARGVKVPTLLNVTLTRGLGVVDPSNSTKYGRADITVLQVTSDINCSALNQITSALSGVQSSLASALDLHLAACGLGITPNAAPKAAPAAVGSNLLSTRTAAAGTGNTVAPAHLVSASFGVAHAELGLDLLHNVTTTTAGPPPPNTGSDLFILAALAVAVAAAGVGLQVLKNRAGRI